MDAAAMLAVAYQEARKGLAEGGIPIGAALFSADGVLLGSGHNRRVQQGDPSLHAETDAFRAAGRQRDYRSTIMVTTLSPCWYCSGLVRQFNIAAVDLSRWHAGGAQADAVAAELDEGLQQAGFILVTGHGIAPELATGVRAASRRFYSLPEGLKRQYSVAVGG